MEDYDWQLKARSESAAQLQRELQHWTDKCAGIEENQFSQLIKRKGKWVFLCVFLCVCLCIAAGIVWAWCAQRSKIQALNRAYSRARSEGMEVSLQHAEAQEKVERLTTALFQTRAREAGYIREG